MKIYSKPGFYVFLIGLIIAFPGILGTTIIILDPNETGLKPYLITLIVGIIVAIIGGLFTREDRNENINNNPKL